MHTYSSRRISSSLYYWHVMRDGSTFFTWSRQGNNSSWIIIARDAKSLHALGSPTTHGRTSKKFQGSDKQLPYSVWEGWEWFTQANNYKRWRLDPFSWSRMKISEHGLGKKDRRAENIQEWVVCWAGDVNDFLELLQLGVCWIWSWCL